MDKRNVVVTRFSDKGDREDENIYTSAIQLARATEWSEHEGDTVAASWDEHEVSGTRPLRRRPGLLAAVEMVEAGEADNIVIAYFDRLCRGLKIQIEVLERVEAAGGDVYALDHGKLTNGTAAVRLSVNMLGAVHQYYAEVIGEKVHPAHQKAVNAGRLPFKRVPPGIIRTADGRARAASAPDEAPLCHVITAFEMCARGENYTAIQAHLAEHGIHRTLHGVQSMFKTKLYIGEVHFGTCKPNLHAHEPIIDRDLFQRAYDRKPRRAGGRPPKSNALLSRLGVLKCGSCGGKLTVNNTINGGTGIYRCQSYGMHKCPNQVTVSKPHIEAHAISEVREYVEREHITGHASREAKLRAADAKVLRTDEALQSLLRILKGVESEEGARESIAAAIAERAAALGEREALGPGGRKLRAHPRDIDKLPAAEQGEYWRSLLTDTGCEITVFPPAAGARRRFDTGRIRTEFKL